MRTMAFTRLCSVVVDGLRRTGAGRAPLGEVGLHVDELHAMVHDRPPERF
jgi:hypothetical protein